MKLLISSICIVLAFFFGYNFAMEQNKKIMDSYESREDFVNISIKKNKLNINQTNQDIQVLINWEYFNSEITLENICE